MATVQELIERYNAEQVGDRLIAIVDGKKDYIADVGSGGFMLTAAGLKLEHDWEQAQLAKAEEKPKAEKKTKAEKAKVEAPAPEPVITEEPDLLDSLG